MSDYVYEEFEKSYNELYKSLTHNASAGQSHRALFLGGQPGTGKSRIINKNDLPADYIVINGDDYRKFHPNFKEISTYDIENMATRTQEFVNQCIELLIHDLSDEGYNLVIEGTLRDPQVPVSTCKLLKDKGYNTDLVIMATDATVSWQSTIYRAELLKELELPPRLVPIDKYNYIVNNLADNVAAIEKAGCFDYIRVIDRNNKILFPNDRSISAASVIKEKLNLDKWNEMYKRTADEFLDAKIDIIQSRRKRSR